MKKFWKKLRTFNLIFIRPFFNRPNFENPCIVETLLKTSEIPWAGADTLKGPYDPTGEGISYEENGQTWIEAGYKLHKDKLFEWWDGPQEIIPISITSNRR